MEASDNSGVGQKGRFYLTKHIWVPQEPIENFNLRMSDMILRRMPKLPLGGEDALRAFPVLAELKKSHDKIKADLNYLLSHHEEIPALHEVHPQRILAQVLNALRAGVEPGALVSIEAERSGSRVALRIVADRPVASQPDRRDDWMVSSLGLWVASQLLDRLGGRLDRRPDGYTVMLPGA